MAIAIVPRPIVLCCLAYRGTDASSCRASDNFTLEEVKGFETADYKIKKKLIEPVFLKEHPDYSYVVVK